MRSVTITTLSVLELATLAWRLTESSNTPLCQARLLVRGHLINSFALLAAPTVASLLLPATLIPAFLGELSVALWMTVKGVNQTVRLQSFKKSQV